MRKDGTSPQRNSRCVPKKDVDKGVKRCATSTVQTVVKKRKTLNSLATPTGISDIEQSSKTSDQKHKAKVKKRPVPSKTTESSKIQVKKVPTQSVKLKQMKTKKEVSQKLVKVKPKKVLIDKLAKKTVKPNQDKQKTSADKPSKDVKSTKKLDKMTKEQGKNASPERRASEVVKIKVTKKPKLVKKIGKAGEKKTCIVSVKIIKKVIPSKLSNVKKIPKKVVKKSCQKSVGIEDAGTHCDDKNDTKKGIASRRKSSTTAGVSKESSPALSPVRETSPVRCKSKKTESKTVKCKEKLPVKPKNKDETKLVDVKNGEIKDNAGADKKKSKDDKKIIQDDLKLVKLEIKREIEDDEQNYQLKETKVNPKITLSKVKIENNLKNENIKLENVLQPKVIEDCNNDSSTSDEIPLEFLKQKINLDDDNANEEIDKNRNESVGGGKRLNKDSDESSAMKSVEEKDKSKAKSKKDSSVLSEKKTSKKDDSATKKVTAKKSTKKDTPAKMKPAVKRKEFIDDKIVKQKVAKLVKKSKLGEIKNRKLNVKVLKDKSMSGEKSDSDQRRMRLFGFWSGPKRHRVASLNASAKVHCLYENESRSSMLEIDSTMSSSSNTTQSSSKYQKRPETRKVESKVKDLVVPESTNTRSLRAVPGLRGVGRHYDILNVSSTTSTSSSSDDASDSGDEKKLALQPSVKQKQQQAKRRQETDSSDDDDDDKEKKVMTKQDESSGKKVKKRRKRHELIMDLKDMVVRKRMASLNASAILAASYSFEKRPTAKKDDGAEIPERKKKKKQPIESSPDLEVEDSSADEDVIVRSTNGSSSKQKVSVIVNQDTDVTITGVYVNSTTRSTHHEGFCSIAGMQYRISSTSHTQTEATAVATETVLHTEHPPPAHQSTSPTAAPPTLAPPCKSYTPLSALSNMQPPGHAQPPPRPPPLSPLGRRHGCSSAFTAPPNYGPHQPPPGAQDPSYIHGYYQPAGPLISHHHHHHSTSSSVSSKLPPAPSTLPTPTPPPSSAPHPASESSDSEVIITTASSESTAPLPYRYPQPYPSYNYQYYPSPPATASLQYPAPSQNHYHQEVCYSAPPSYPPSYFHHKSGPYHPPSGYHRRYGPPPPQYYPQEFYSTPPNPSGNLPPQPSQQQMIVTAPAGTTSSAYPPPDSNYQPPPAPIVDPYPPPPPTYYPAYSAGPPPPCYSHSPPTRSLAFIDAAYQSCPCPMQSCPKNVHTGPLTGASKGSLKNHQTTPLPPVALALPLEPPGALGPPSPARGSAGMPPPPSPALATARNPSSGQWGDSPPAIKPAVDNKSETGLLAISKVLSESVLVADQDMNCIENTIVALSIPKTEHVKIEVEDTSYSVETLDVKNNRKRRKSLKCTAEIKKQNVEVSTFPVVDIAEIKVQPEVQERLALPPEKIERTTSSDSESPVEKQIPLSDNRATVPVKKQAKKRKSMESDLSEPLAKVGKSVKKSKVKYGKKKCVKRDKVVTEENIEPTEVDTNSTKNVIASKVNNRRRSSKVVERRKSSSSVREENIRVEDEQRVETTVKKKPARGKKTQEKTKADHMLRSQVGKERRSSKSGRGSKPSTQQTNNSSSKTLLEGDDGETTALALLGPRKSHPLPKWSNGWSWEGQPYKAKVFITMDDGAVVRKCYPAMRHSQGDVIHPRDCVLLKSGPRKIDLPFVAKVAAMWENPEDGEMMVSLLWYYRPEHTEQGRRLEDTPDEIFASRHKDINSVACIEDKCFVLTFNEYCRYRKNARRLEEGLSVPGRVVPTLEGEGSSYPRLERQPLGQVSPDLVFFCRRVYDFRQKRILKNPC